MIKHFLLLLLMSWLPFSSSGQRALKRQRASVNAGECIADSVTRALTTLRHQADAILTFQYYYDNGGTAEFVTVLWQSAGKTFVKVYRGCESAYVPKIRAFKPDTLFSFYHYQHIAQLPEMARPANAPSHGMAYLIGVYLPGKTRFYNVRNSQRHLLRYAKQPLLPGEEPVEATEDPRSLWLNLFEQVIEKPSNK